MRSFRFLSVHFTLTYVSCPLSAYSTVFHRLLKGSAYTGCAIVDTVSRNEINPVYLTAVHICRSVPDPPSHRSPVPMKNNNFRPSCSGEYLHGSDAPISPRFQPPHASSNSPPIVIVIRRKSKYPLSFTQHHIPVRLVVSRIALIHRIIVKYLPAPRFLPCR